MKLPERQQLLIIGTAVVVVAAFGLLWFYPLSRESLKYKTIRAAQALEAQKVDQCRTMLPAMRDRAERLESETAQFDVRIPGSRQFAGLWQQIAEVMKRHHLTDEIVQPGKEVPGEVVNRIPITIQCSGSMSQIFDMLNSLGSFKRTIHIGKLDMVNDTDFSGQIKLNAEANVYYGNSVSRNIQTSR